MRHPLSPDDYPRSELEKARRRHLVRQSALLQRPLTGPLEAGLILSYRCNHGCQFCALPLVAGGRGEMAPALAEKAIDELAAADTEQVDFTGGGEPMMSDALPALVERVRARGLACSVCTNGSHLTAALVERWVRLGVHVAVSFNAADEATYRQVHRGAVAGDFDRILDHLRDFSARAAREGGEGSFVSLNFVIHRANWRQVEAMADLTRSVGASQIQYRLIQPREEHRDLQLTDNELRQTREAVRRVETAAATEAAFTVQIAEALREAAAPSVPATLRPGVVPEAFHDDRTRVPCLEGYVATYVDHDGTVFPCCMRSADIRSHYMGHLATTAFADIWHGAAYAAFRREAADLPAGGTGPAINGCAQCPKAKQFLYLIDEFAPGNYLDLVRRRARTLQAQQAERARRFQAHVVLPAPSRRVTFVRSEMTPTVAPRAVLRATVTLRNDSERTWPAWDLAGEHAVGVGYHLLDARGRMVRFDNNPRTYLPRDLSPGETITVDVEIAAPEQPGDYLVRLAVVQERVAWFEQVEGARDLPLCVRT
jgi:MoaA/NifB/PqqE/SkfB family radical SAM enzyme